MRTFLAVPAALLDAYLKAELWRVVPRAGIEPALLSEPHFECGASTSSANGARITREEAITRAFEEDKMSQTNMNVGASLAGAIAPGDQFLVNFEREVLTAFKEQDPPMDPVDHKVESLVANGERPSADLMQPHSKPFQTNVWSTYPVPLPQSVVNFKRRLRDLSWEIRVPGNLQFQFMYDSRGHFYAQVFEEGAIDNVTGEKTDWYGRKWLLSEHMTDAEIVQTVFKAVMTAVEHEVREQFLYKGQSILDPHYDIEKLVELRKEKAALVFRNGSTA